MLSACVCHNNLLCRNLVRSFEEEEWIQRSRGRSLEGFATKLKPEASLVVPKSSADSFTMTHDGKQLL
jgi:hypothetical protein